jgi:Cytosine/adenosine deaminases
MQDIKQLLPIGYTRGLELHPILLGKVHKTKINAVLAYIKHIPIYQAEELDHLKRIHKHPTENDFLNIVLCSVKDKDKLNNQELEAAGVEEITTIEVSKYPPYTKEQYEKFKIPWPVNMKNKVNDIITFKSNELAKIEEFMKRAIELAKMTYSKGNRFNACLLVDPSKNNEVLMDAVDETGGLIESINHCVMRLTDKFGKFCCEKNKGIKKVKKNRNESSFEVVQEDQNPLEEEKSASTDPVPPKRKATDDIQEYFPTGYYYCSNLDLYLVMEPCIMCSMALVHSRIRRVFYSIPYEGPGTGGINEKLQINNLQGLNHKYAVFYNILSSFALSERDSVHKL